jgi:periplasmic protein TonB
METKKNQGSDINKMRGGFFLIGIIIACGLSLSAFEYRQFSQKEKEMYFGKKEIIDDTDIIFDIEPPKPKIEQPQERREQISNASANTSTAPATEINTTTGEVDPNQGLLGLGSDSIFIGGSSEEPFIDPSIEYDFVESMPYCAECAHYKTNEERAQCTFITIHKKMKQEAKYPADAKEIGAQGTVEVSFRINTEGEIEDIKIVRSVFHSLDKEAKRTVTKLPKMIPGEQRGKKVNVRYRTKLKFELR